MTIERDSLEGMAQTALDAFPPRGEDGAIDVEPAIDFACRLLWKEVAARKKSIGKLTTLQLNGLRETLTEIVLSRASGASAPVHRLDAAGAESTADRKEVAMSAEQRETIRSVIAQAFETTFDGSQERKSLVAGWAIAESERCIAGWSVGAFVVEEARQSARQCVEHELEAL
jgi:hypothetical protein